MGSTLENVWTIEDSTDLYNLERWGLGFFEINERGHLVANIGNGGKQLSILEAIQQANLHGVQAPFIVRFPDIIHQRISQINAAFQQAIQQCEYKGNYRCFYPCKVNQHREVIRATIEGGRSYGGGVEAGSKAELLAVLLMSDNDVPVLCNGFKDHTIVEMALRAGQLGRDVTVILEKPGELDLVIQIARRLNVVPKLGVRVKLAARTGGRWNASAGSKSKFGLTAYQLTQTITRLKAEGMVDCLNLLHFHPGSQISNVRKIKTSLVEAARVYADLIKNDVPLKIIDVGGGLAIDYTGERNMDPSSKNYTLEEYANDVVYYIQQVCRDAGVPEPDLISESGRAITAHHSLLVVPVLENHMANQESDLIDESICNSSSVLRELRGILDSVSPGNLLESYHDAQDFIETVWQRFSHGSLSLRQRSCGELLVGKICQKVAGLLGELDFVPSELEDLRHQLADTYVANFSLFQALPDSWALNQVFPILPIHRLNERPTRRAVIGDITCDSDGKIECFIGSKGGRNSLPLHELNGQTYYVGVFLIGAYQEALSDDHNLMGNFHVIIVSAEGEIEILEGATTMEVLHHVHHCREELIGSLNDSIETAAREKGISRTEESEIRLFFNEVMRSYTYLAPNQVKQSQRLPESHFLAESLALNK